MDPGTQEANEKDAGRNTASGWESAGSWNAVADGPALMHKVTPALRISEIGGRVRLGMDGFGDVEGATLQEAANALVARLLQIAMALRSGGVGPIYPAGCPDLAQLEFVWQLGDYAAAGGDPRDLLFGQHPPTP